MRAISDQRSAVSGIWSGAGGFRALLGAMIGLLSLTSPALGDANDFLLVRRSASPQMIQLAAIGEQYLSHSTADRAPTQVPLHDCVALVNPAARQKPRTAGLLMLADGQRLPGEAAPAAEPGEDMLAWNHPWLGRIDVPLQSIETILFTANATPPQPGQLDVVALTNGDRQEGLITSLGRTITLEVERAGTPPSHQNLEIPLNRVASVTMIVPQQSSAAGSRRIWFEDGTVIDSPSLTIGDDGFVRLGGSSLFSGTQPARAGVSQVNAILFTPGGMIPLATLTPTRVEGPPTRYQLPQPTVLNADAPLGLSAIEFQGPLVTRYALPAAAGPGARFAAEAELPRFARTWGDFELVIRSDDSEVFRTTLNAANPVAAINIALTGRELTIELTEGADGPIQDRLILHRPMLLPR